MEKICSYKHSDIRAYVQNRMDRKEETEFQHHLMNCKECRDELEHLRQIVHYFGKKEQRKPPFYIWMVAASIIVIVVGGTYWYQWSIQQKSAFSVPSNGQKLKQNPPILYNEKDSISSSSDSVSADTMLIIIAD